MSGYPSWSDEYEYRPVPPPVYPPQLQHQRAAVAAAARGGGSWLLPDYAGGGRSNGYATQPVMRRAEQEYRAGGGGGEYAHSHGSRVSRGNTSDVSFDTSAKDPESLRARVFIGSLNASGEVTREDVIELAWQIGQLRGVTFFKRQGYAFVQFESPADAESACRQLNGIRWRGCVLDVHPVDPNQQPSAPAAAAAAAAEKYEDISYDTSSKDPVLLRARVFISLGYNSIMRSEVIELFQPFGKITATTLFKGYAFIQFESPVDAVSACEKLNGTMFNGNKVDVHLAMEGSSRKRNPDAGYGSATTTTTTATASKGSAPSAAAYRSAADTTQELKGTAPKRPREEPDLKTGCEMICKVCRFTSGDVAEFLKHREQPGGGCVRAEKTGEPPSLACSSCEAVLPNAWRMLFHLMDDHHHALKLVNVEKSRESIDKARAKEAGGKVEWWKAVKTWMEGQPKEEEAEVEEEEDVKGPVDVTIVCQACRLVTEDWTTYREHRRSGECYKMRDAMEPSCFVCSMCAEPFTTAWRALFHLMDFHRMKLFSPDHTKEGLARAAEQQTREKPGVDRRMKAWIDKQ